MNDSDNIPVIGVTTYYQDAQWGDWSGEAAILPGNYLNALVDAGSSPVLLPPRGTHPEFLRLLDGLMIIGGPDVDPNSYSEEPHPATVSDPDRDAHEFALLGAAEAADIPLLCICRGAQILNIAHGGTLHQHLPEVLPDGGRYRAAPAVFTDTEITVDPGTLAYGILGGSCVVSSYHHQGINAVGRDLKVTARSADGLPQVLESTGDAWLVATQYHPEEKRLDDARLFSAFVNACREHGSARKASDSPRPWQKEDPR
ncbi:MULTISPECIES: gamma-glutamyl-gamma-aminobutyrate hydrolase family protein [Micrococcaceae]|uniref:gamma-glutamyl-gamma-aminobutyrate hydrolase family protein n=1 Tax=unclassified Kocuria TaxID=2649579 RepID=UPI001010A9DD|nr:MULTISPECIES: gamma-glutamyl-gamma-aminobutyrate hydrolase family protein [unclassified Kocuria]